MKRLVAYLALAGMLFSLCACTGKIATDKATATPAASRSVSLVPKTQRVAYLTHSGLTTETEDIEYETAYDKVTVMVTQISGLKDKTVEQKINDSIKADVKSAVAIIAKEEKRTPYLYTTVGLDANNYLSVSIEWAVDGYNPPLFAALYDLKTGNKVALKNLFTTGTDYVTLLNKKIIESLMRGFTNFEGNTGSFYYEDNEILSQPFTSITANQAFCLTDSSLFLIFAPGENGFSQRQGIEIPLSEIDPYLNILDTQPDATLYENTDLMVQTNHIFLHQQGYASPAKHGKIYVYYPVVSGIQDEAFQKSINAQIQKLAAQPLADEAIVALPRPTDPMMNDSVADISFSTVFNDYGMLTVQRYVFSKSDYKSYYTTQVSFDLVHNRTLDSTVQLDRYLTAHNLKKDFVQTATNALIANLYPKSKKVEQALQKADDAFLMKHLIIGFNDSGTETGPGMNINLILPLGTVDGMESEITASVSIQDLTGQTDQAFFKDFLNMK